MFGSLEASFGSLEALKALIAAIEHPIVLTRGPIVVMVNDTWLSVIGYRREEVEGRPFLDFIPPEERLRLARRATLRAREPEKAPYAAMTSVALKADGRSSMVYVQPTVIATADGPPYILNVLFIVPERDAEVELAELLVAASSCLVKARTILEVRELAVTRLGEGGYTAAFFRPDGEAIFPAEAVLPPNADPDALEEALVEERAVFVGRPEIVNPEAVILPIQRGAEVELFVLAGPHLVTALRASLRLFAQGVASALATGALIADLERRNRELSETRAELVRHERLAALGEMAASVAHEVRNPVGVIANAVTTLRRQLGGEPRDEGLLTIVDEECLRLARMVRDLLDFARPRAVGFTFEPLYEIAEEAILVASSQPDFALRHVRFEIERCPKVPNVRVDRDLLRQALVNLLINATQASPEGGTVIVRVGLHPTQSAEVEVPSISVIDCGGGMPNEIVDRIFDPFFTTRAQGTGLGLAVVRRVVEDLGAKIHVENSFGEGATFRLEFS